mmetsp:Transcript_4530/g.2569  ORF Transcript_4530/g.2569 Transcript_4530/m.2569 type:complete len:138 (+) Transcript_4530:201-614(+)
MMKNFVVLLAVFIAAVMLATVIQSRPTKRLDERTQMCRLIAEGRLGWESEPWGRGGQKFQEVCKSCHFRENDKGAPFLHAQSKMSKGWNRVFAKRRVQCAKDGSWDVLTEEDIQFVNDYLFRNAAWTYDPNNADSCG